jgi:hypothetical protein
MIPLLTPLKSRWTVPLSWSIAPPKHKVSVISGSWDAVPPRLWAAVPLRLWDAVPPGSWDEVSPDRWDANVKSEAQQKKLKTVRGFYTDLDLSLHVKKGP